MIAQDGVGFGVLSPLANDMTDMANWKITPFNDTSLMIGLLAYATGFGLFVGGGAIYGNYVLQGIDDKYKAKGAVIAKANKDTFWLLSWIGLGLGAGGVGMAILFDDTATEISALCLSGAGVIVNIFDFYIFTRDWLMDINVAIAAKGL
jgi:hypothetical protein